MTVDGVLTSVFFSALLMAHRTPITFAILQQLHSGTITCTETIPKDVQEILNVWKDRLIIDVNVYNTVLHAVYSHLPEKIQEIKKIGQAIGEDHVTAGIHMKFFSSRVSSHMFSYPHLQYLADAEKGSIIPAEIKTNAPALVSFFKSSDLFYSPKLNYEVGQIVVSLPFDKRLWTSLLNLPLKEQLVERIWSDLKEHGAVDSVNFTVYLFKAHRHQLEDELLECLQSGLVPDAYCWSRLEGKISTESMEEIVDQHMKELQERYAQNRDSRSKYQLERFRQSLPVGMRRTVSF